MIVGYSRVFGGGNDAFTKVLLHFDGTNGGTTFTDSCAGASPHTFTASGTGNTSTAKAKFGTASLACGAAAGWVTAPDSADFSLGAGNWTIDLWVYVGGGAGTTRNIGGQVGGGGADRAWQLYQTTENVFAFIVRNTGGTSVTVTGTTAVTSTGWHHLAAVRTANVIRLFVDGVQEGGDQAFTGTAFNGTSILAVGDTGVQETPFNGFIDEFRLSVGIARWTSTFGPPSAPYS